MNAVRAGNPVSNLKRYERIAPLYDLLDFPFEHFRYRRLRPLLFRGLAGRLLDAGVGTGRHREGCSQNCRMPKLRRGNRGKRTARSRKDSVDHGQAGSDDFANVLFGALYLAAGKREQHIPMAAPFVVSRPYNFPGSDGDMHNPAIGRGESAMDRAVRGIAVSRRRESVMLYER